MGIEVSSRVMIVTAQMQSGLRNNHPMELVFGLKFINKNKKKNPSL